MNDSVESPLLFDTGRGLSCSWKGRRLYHPERPIEQACKRSKLFIPREQEIIFIPSPLLWHGVEPLLDELPATSIILAVEAEPSLYQLSRENITETLMMDRRLTLLPASKVDRFLKELDSSGLRRSRMLTLNGGYPLHRELYTRIFESILSSIRRFWQNRMTFTCFGPLWLKNLFANCAILGSDRQAYYPINKFKSEKPVLIIGAGPSLDEVLPLIKEYRSCFTILSVVTALASLSAHGVVPDFGLAQDGQFHTIGDFSCAPEMLAVPIFFDLTSTKSLPRHLKGGILPFITRFDQSNFTGRLEQSLSGITALPPLGSVGITALEIAHLLAPPEIWITGLDFAYLLGKSHAKGSPYHLRELYQRSRLMPEGDFSTILARKPSILTNKKTRASQVYSDPVLNSYHDTFSNQLHRKEYSYQLDHQGHKPIHNPSRHQIPHRIIHSLRSPLSSEGQMRSALDTLGETYANAPELRFTEDEHTMEQTAFPSDQVSKEELTTFLKQELQRLEQYLAGDSSLIEEIDYTYRFFPDLHRFNPADPDPGFIKRIEASARQFKRQIEGALTLHRF